MNSTSFELILRDENERTIPATAISNPAIRSWVEEADDRVRVMGPYYLPGSTSGPELYVYLSDGRIASEVRGDGARVIFQDVSDEAWQSTEDLLRDYDVELCW